MKIRDTYTAGEETPRKVINDEQTRKILLFTVRTERQEGKDQFIEQAS